MNAPISLLQRTLRATVGVHSHVPSTHVSTAIGLGTDRRGTGTIVSPDGLIVTVHYLLLGAKNVIVTLPNGEQCEAKIVGKDYSTGLGLLQLDAGAQPHLKVVSSESCVAGEEAFSVASLGGEKRCADCGIITYLGPFDAVWEFVLDRCVCVTASSLSIGFPGGAIVNRRGEVVAINYLNFADLGRAILGVPGEYFLTVRDELMKHGHRTTAIPRAWLGVLSYTLREHVVIAGVMPGGPGEKAGLQQGDLVLAVDGRDINERRVLYETLGNRNPGEQISLKVLRNNRIYQVDIPAMGAEDYFA
ncbi:MAG TPA: S1C family serine protease [Candidatus Binataceae bacterium]|nr:S1C family serine protease [Candidatus Binataceae bacterium]